jgi:hypothetical protein
LEEALFNQLRVAANLGENDEAQMKLLQPIVILTFLPDPACVGAKTTPGLEESFRRNPLEG